MALNWGFIKRRKRNQASPTAELVMPTSMFDVDAAREHAWSQDMGLSLAGYPENVVILVAAKLRRYLMLIDHAAYASLRDTDMLLRFDQAVAASYRLKRQGIYVGSVEENLLVQSQLQRANNASEVDVEQITGAYRNFDLIMGRAIEAGASDVHFEFRDASMVTVRIRVHGKLRQADPSDRLARDYTAMIDAVSAAYNSRADPSSRSHNYFDGAYHQSCSIPFAYRTRNYQFRFQSVKENRGTDVVMRVLLNEVVEADIKSLQALGYSEDQVRIMEDAIHRSPGLLIVAGETGSGKSTTLRTLMTYERDSGKKFFSIEDPVEYIQPHVTQIPIQRKAESLGFSTETPFSAAAKVVLRSDPDKVMPGEIRDRETGAFAKSMTETGHQVLSTVHASSCFSIVNRLTSDEVGIPLESISAPSFLTAMVYQKLLPIVCPHCCVPGTQALEAEMLQTIANLHFDVCDLRVTGPGCVHCKMRGTIGQTVVAEVCEVTPSLLNYIRRGDIWVAEELWRTSRNRDLRSPVMTGRTAMEHALCKMGQGLIDPRDVESAFYRLARYYDAEYRPQEQASLAAPLASDTDMDMVSKTLTKA